MGRRGNNSDSDEDETLYYRYTTPSSSSAAPSSISGGSSGAGTSNTLGPSKSTIYISNLDFNLTNSDLFTLFSTFGKVARVTVLKDRHTRLSKGVAFVLFVSRDDAVSAARAMSGKVLNGRVLRASIANDNGRAPEFIRRRVYKDKSRCYECGEGGHLSYECHRNQLGPREQPVPKKGRGEKAQRRKGEAEVKDDEAEAEEGDGVAFDDHNWASVVDNSADQRLLMEEKAFENEKKKGMKVKRASYFSDESDEEEE